MIEVYVISCNNIINHIKVGELDRCGLVYFAIISSTRVVEQLSEC